MTDIICLEQQSRESRQCSATDADTSDMSDIITIALDNRRSRSTTHHHHSLEIHFITSTQAIGKKFRCLIGWQSIDRRIDISTSHACQHHLFHVFQMNAIVVKILAKGTIERSDRVGCLDANRSYHLSLAINSYDFRGTDSHVYSNNDSHILSFYVNTTTIA